MPLHDDLKTAIRQRDLRAILRLMFHSDGPVLRQGVGTESELWDFKKDCPRLGKKYHPAWADVSKEVLGFHNHAGGVLLFGIDDAFKFVGATQRLDSKLFNDQIRRYLGDLFWVDYYREFIQADQRYLGVALIPPRGQRPGRFVCDAPTVNGRRLFKRDGAAIREGDSTRVLRPEDASRLAKELLEPEIGQVYSVDIPHYRILSPDYGQFVLRDELCRKVERALRDPRTSVTSLVGVGGVGKTAIATWAVQQAYERSAFEFIVSVTAKDRELTGAGIQSIEPSLTSFEQLLDDVLTTLEFPDLLDEPIADKERDVRALLDGSQGLLYVDNLETVDDDRIIQFLDDLPPGVRAITTSRRSRVRVAVRPVDVTPMTDAEGDKFIRARAEETRKEYLLRLSQAERARVVQACDGLPLAIVWALARARSAADALELAEGISDGGLRSEELLEFCFRRVFEALPGAEKAVLQVAALFTEPIAPEAVSVATELPLGEVLDAANSLVSDGLMQSIFDSKRNDRVFRLMPLTGRFVYQQVARQPKFERDARRRLGRYFDATDVRDQRDRAVIRELRQGRAGAEEAVLNLAIAAERRGDLRNAEDLYRQALERSPTSWRAARLFAEFLRHKRRQIGDAIRMYERAAANAPRRGQDRAMIYREWGMLLRNSGESDAAEKAIEKFEIALAETPNDAIAIHALAHMRARRGEYAVVAELLEPLRKHPNPATREKTIPLLCQAYEELGEIVKASELRALGQSREQD